MFDTDEIQGIDNGFISSGPEGLSSVMDNVARSMTAAMRSASNSSSAGVSHTTIPYYHIRWAWIVLPLVLFLLAIAFVLLVILAGLGVMSGNSTEVWKNNVNAALFHGPDADTRHRLGPLNTENSIDQAAEDLLVRMTEGRES